MFWAAVDPVRYAFILLCSTVVLTTVFAPKLGWKRIKTFFLSAFCTLFLIFPVAFGIAKIMDPLRFGIFHYQNHAAISSQKIARWLPPAAKDITVNQTMGGFEAKYSIGHNEMKDWLDRHWVERGSRAVESREEAKSEDTYYFIDEKSAAKLGWTFPVDVSIHPGPRGTNYAGFTIWFSEAEGIAFHDAGYW